MHRIKTLFDDNENTDFMPTGLALQHPLPPRGQPEDQIYAEFHRVPITFIVTPLMMHFFLKWPPAY